jgi:hypothetical protein
VRTRRFTDDDLRRFEALGPAAAEEVKRFRARHTAGRPAIPDATYRKLLLLWKRYWLNAKGTMTKEQAARRFFSVERRKLIKAQLGIDLKSYKALLNAFTRGKTRGAQAVREHRKKNWRHVPAVGLVAHLAGRRYELTTDPDAHALLRHAEQVALLGPTWGGFTLKL